MNNTLSGILLIIVMVGLCLGSYIVYDVYKDVDRRFVSLECDSHRHNYDVEGTCDSRFWRFKRCFDAIDPNIFEQAVQENW